MLKAINMRASIYMLCTAFMQAQFNNTNGAKLSRDSVYNSEQAILIKHVNSAKCCYDKHNFDYVVKTTTQAS